jgi:hypothetical protein
VLRKQPPELLSLLVESRELRKVTTAKWRVTLLFGLSQRTVEREMKQ